MAVDYLREDLEKLAKKRENRCPNVLLVSGDLTTKCAPKEYFYVKQFLQNIKEIFHLDYEHICIVPGNHDVNLTERKKYVTSGSDSPYLYEKDFKEKLGPNFVKPPEEPRAPYLWRLFPELRLCVVGFDSNVLIPQDLKNFPSDSELFEKTLMCGRIGKTPLEILEEFLNTKKEEIPDFAAFTKIVLLHHHVIPVPSEEFKPFNILTDSGTFLKKLAKMDIDIILHGHEHSPFAARLKYGRGLQDESKRSTQNDMLILGAGSAGSDRLKYEEGIANHYSIIEIDNLGWNVKRDPITVWIEWRHNTKKNWKFKQFSETAWKIKEE